MILLSAVIGVGAAVLLLTGGYLFGANRGYQAREQLRRQNVEQAEEIGTLRQRVSAPDDGDENLRATIKNVLAPLMQREQLSFDLSHLTGASGRRSDLTALVDQIAERGNFSAVLLSDEAGWPLGSSSGARDLERLGATASLVFLLADRIGRDSAPAPLSLMVHDEANTVTLCRIFRVAEQRLALTAVSSGAQLTPTALDPALVKIAAVLSN
ncbi:MAG: hypothetical protein IPI02_07365 [Sterolibacteriaceae bacterium]|nr:hypothetical protein [Sterolibacteriaceae bacterium]